MLILPSRLQEKFRESLFASLVMEYWWRRKAAQWQVGRIPLSNWVTLLYIPWLGHQCFFCIAGQQPTVGHGADAIAWGLQAVRSLKSPSPVLAVDLRAINVSSADSRNPLPFSMQWWEPLWGHEPPCHLWELRDGLPHTLPGVHRR